MFAEVRSKKCSEITDNSSEEHYDSYELLPEKPYDKSIRDCRKESERDDDFINDLTSSINNKMLSVSNGKPGPAQMVEMTKFFIDKSAEVAMFCEEQRTKRAEIRARAQVAIHQIDAVREFCKAILIRHLMNAVCCLLRNLRLSINALLQVMYKLWLCR